MSKKHIIVYTFQSLEDPLIKGLMLEYLKWMQLAEEQFIFHLITHEHNEYRLGTNETSLRRKELQKLNIHWYPVKYRSGFFILLKKAFNFLQTFFIALKIKLKFKAGIIVGFLSIPGSFSYIISKALRMKLVIYCFEPHSEYMVDFGIWKKNSLKYILLRFFEKRQLIGADYIVVPNSHTEKLIKPYTKGNVLVTPICIDVEQMYFDREAREQIRNDLNIHNRTVVIYTGKFGGIYYSAEQVISFFKKLHAHNKNLFFYIITPDIDEVKKNIAKSGLSLSCVHVSPVVSYTSLHRYISAADIGFVALPPLPSQKFRTPVKTAIYLSCGIPYLVNRGIAEDDLVAEKENVGVVINDLEDAPELISEKIRLLLADEKLHKRCRQVAEETRSIKVAREALKKTLSAI